MAIRPPRMLRRRRRNRPPRLRGITLNKLLPNMLTLCAMAAGMTGMRFAMAGQFREAVVSIAVAAVFDALDGRIARMLNGQSKFGEELDSLSDVVSFGVAPAMILYTWTLAGAQTFGWVACLLLGACAALRLARFNTMLGAAAEKPAWAYNYFTGVPAPAGAGLALLPLMASLVSGPGWFDSPWLVVPWTVLVAGLMISAIPTFSAKGMRIPQRYVPFVLLGLIVVIAALVSAPWATLSVVTLFYALSLPFSSRQYAKLKHEAERLAEEDAAELALQDEGGPPPENPPPENPPPDGTAPVEPNR